MRLIDADALIDEIKNGLWDWDSVDGIKSSTVLKQTISDINNMPTIDAEPIKHGKWIPLYPHDVPITNEYKCSVCGLGFDEDEETECVVYDTFKYCPHCGSRMDGE